MRIQWTAKGNRDAGSSCLCDRGLHRYLRNFGGGGFEHPKPTPLGTPLAVTIHNTCCNTHEFPIFPTRCIYCFRMIQTTNSDYFLVHHSPIRLHNADFFCEVRTVWLLWRVSCSERKCLHEAHCSVTLWLLSPAIEIRQVAQHMSSRTCKLHRCWLWNFSKMFCTR